MFPIGLGGMPWSVSGRPDEAQAIRTVHAALDAGVTLIDTADAYALDESEVGHNERLIAKALRGRREDVVVATKGGTRAAGRRGSSTGAVSTCARRARPRCGRWRPIASTSTSTTARTRSAIRESRSAP